MLLGPHSYQRRYLPFTLSRLLKWDGERGVCQTVEDYNYDAAVKIWDFNPYVVVKIWDFNYKGAVQML